jgi:hypothetical protein
MNPMKKKMFLFAACLTLGGTALPVVAQQALPDKLSDVTVQHVISNCDGGPPAGYVLVQTKPDGLCGAVGRAMVRYVFESYFDKPVGSTMRICNAYAPPGWYIIRTDKIRMCLTPQTFVITRAE